MSAARLVKTREQSSSTAEHADEVAQTLLAIGEQITTILTLNQHIAEASDQQSQAAEAINQSLHQLTNIATKRLKMAIILQQLAPNCWPTARV